MDKRGVLVRFVAMASSQKSSDRIKVTCNCGASLMAPKKAVGKKVKCPRCDKVFTVPDPGSTVDRMIYALSDDQYNKPPLEEQPEPPAPKETEKGKLCPNCNSEMPKEAALCIRCGFHLDRGAAIAAASVTGRAAARGRGFSLLQFFKEGWPSEALTVPMGILGSAIGAALGGLIYYAVMAGTGYQIGYIAVLVGVASGYGALLLGRSPTYPGAISAALLSLAAIGVAEYAYFRTSLREGVQTATQGVEFEEDFWRDPPRRVYFETQEDYDVAVAEHGDFVELDPEQQEEWIERKREDFERSMQVLRKAVLGSISFWDYLTEDGVNFIVTFVFGALGIAYGFKVGAGYTLGSED